MDLTYKIVYSVSPFHSYFENKGGRIKINNIPSVAQHTFQKLYFFFFQFPYLFERVKDCRCFTWVSNMGGRGPRASAAFPRPLPGSELEQPEHKLVTLCWYHRHSLATVPQCPPTRAAVGGPEPYFEII